MYIWPSIGIVMSKLCQYVIEMKGKDMNFQPLEQLALLQENLHFGVLFFFFTGVQLMIHHWVHASSHYILIVQMILSHQQLQL